MASTPLAIAIAAGVLLAVVIGADVTYNRTLYVDASTGPGSWTTIAQDPCCRAYEYARGPSLIDANRSDNITMRLRIDNGYPTVYRESFVVFAGSAEIARGELQAPARSEGVAPFSVPAAIFLGPNATVPVPEKGIPYAYGGIEVEVGSTRLFASPGIREVAK